MGELPKFRIEALSDLDDPRALEALHPEERPMFREMKPLLRELLRYEGVPATRSEPGSAMKSPSPETA